MLDRLLSSRVEEEETQIKARALNLLTLVTALIALLYTLVVLLTAPEELAGNAGLALAAALLLSLACYWLSQQGRVRLAGYLFFAGLFVAISFNLIDPANQISGLTMAPFLYILVILPAGYILHPGVSFVAATLAVTFTIGFLSLWPPPGLVESDNVSGFWTNIGLAFALFYILSAVAWVFSRGIQQALQQARTQNRELREIAQELERQRELHANTSREIQDLAEQLATYSSRQARGASRQAAAVSQVSTSIEELENSAREIARNAGTVHGAARETLHKARESQDVTLMNNEAMAVLHTKAKDGASHARDLDERLAEINHVATIISNIASQTQLVAFNATLEAAEAGVAGQRFAVVAAEVKDLAADSLKQAKQVADIIREVQEVGESVVALGGEQVRAVETGGELMGRSNAANQDIMQSATRMAEQAAQIEQSTAQQQQASEQVAASMEEIQAVVDRWVVSSYQMDELVASLRGLAEQLA